MNQLSRLPDSIGEIKQLQSLNLSFNELTILPESIGRLTQLQQLSLTQNQLAELPTSLSKLENLKELYLEDNPLNPELAAAYKEGIDAIKLYLRLKIGPQIILNEAKLILVGEGEVGKTCLMDALLDNPWQEHATTHGI